MTEKLQKQKQMQKSYGYTRMSRNKKVKFIHLYPSLENDLVPRVYITVA